MSNTPNYILGISAFYHDSAACLLKDGEILAAAQEERFTRKKHDPEFPTNAVEYCLKEAGITGKGRHYRTEPHQHGPEAVWCHVSRRNPERDE